MICILANIYFPCFSRFSYVPDDDFDLAGGEDFLVGAVAGGF